MLRAGGHRGIAVSHYAFDRAVHDPLFGKLLARHHAYYDDRLRPQECEGGLGELLDWVVGAPCCLHDAHNALRWSLSPRVSEAELKDLHIVLESLRSSYMLLVQRVPRFLAQVVEFADGTQSIDSVLGVRSSVGRGLVGRASLPA